MEENYGLVLLTDKELREHNGGAFPVLLMKIFVPTIESIRGFFDGLREGYVRTTPS